jgi:hypothetical protein
MVSAWLRRALCLGVALFAGSAQAQEKQANLDLQVGFLGMGEVWQDVSIIENYRSSRFAGAGFGSLGVRPHLLIEAELGYMSMSSDVDRVGVAPGSMEVVPITLAACYRAGNDRAEVFAGGGYAMVVFTERTDVGTVAGSKPGADLRAGVRIHTNLVQPAYRPTGTPGVRGMDVELLIGRRQHHAFGVGEGFDFSAWRGGIGLVARL